MLRGMKPLAYFLNVVASEFDANIRYWRMFDRHVAAGRLIKREVFEVFANLETSEIVLRVTRPRVADRRHAYANERTRSLVRRPRTAL